MEKNSSVQFQINSYSSDEAFANPKRQQRYVSGPSVGKWTQLQNVKYIVFIQYHKNMMKSRSKRRIAKFYKEMSKFIQTRNSLQCRSHHQKLQDRYRYPNKIILNFKQNNDLALYKQIYEQLKEIQLRQPSFGFSSGMKLQENKKDVGVQTDIEGIQINLFAQESQPQESITPLSFQNQVLPMFWYGMINQNALMPPQLVQYPFYNNAYMVPFF